MNRSDRVEAVVTAGGEQFTAKDARALSTVLITAAEDLEGDADGGTVVMRDDRGRELFNGRPLTAEACRQLATQLTDAAVQADDANVRDR
jgi:hypothetical protein